MRTSDVVAGALLANTVPHVVRGITGHSGLTPLAGEGSSPAVNLVWAAVNAGAAAALLRAGGWRRIDPRAAAERLVAVQGGALAVAAFGMAYELTAGRRRRAADVGGRGYRR